MHRMEDFVAIRSRQVCKELAKLDVSKATGPDKISAYILKELASEITVPITILSRRILNEGCWPASWKLHHIVPIFKRSLPFLPQNYRGVHLTSVISKTVERVIGAPLIQYLQVNSFGTNQWAFTKRRSARDLATLCVSKWLLQICSSN